MTTKRSAEYCLMLSVAEHVRAYIAAAHRDIAAVGRYTERLMNNANTHYIRRHAGRSRPSDDHCV